MAAPLLRCLRKSMSKSSSCIQETQTHLRGTVCQLLRSPLPKSEISWVRCHPSFLKKGLLLRAIGLTPKKDPNEEEEKGMTMNQLLSWLHLPHSIDLDDSDDIAARLNLRRYRKMKDQMISFYDKAEFLGADLAAAQFVLFVGGAVKLQGRETWFQKEGDINPLPRHAVDNLIVEAIDLSNTFVMSAGLINMVKLSHLKCLNLSNCPYVDDWFLADLHNFNTLEILDISGCQEVTDHGIASLQCLRNLKGLKMENMTKVSFKGLLSGLLEEVIPDLQVRGLTETDFEPLARQDRGERRLVRALLGYFDEVEDLPQEDKLEFISEADPYKRRLMKVDW